MGNFILIHTKLCLEGNSLFQKFIILNGLALVDSFLLEPAS